MKNLLGGSSQNLHAGVAEAMQRSTAAKIHLYGKDPRPGRKVGHINILSQTTRPQEDDDAAGRRLERARRAAAEIAEIIVEGAS